MLWSSLLSLTYAILLEPFHLRNDSKVKGYLINDNDRLYLTPAGTDKILISLNKVPIGTITNSPSGLDFKADPSHLIAEKPSLPSMPSFPPVQQSIFPTASPVAQPVETTPQPNPAADSNAQLTATNQNRLVKQGSKTLPTTPQPVPSLLRVRNMNQEGQKNNN